MYGLDLHLRPGDAALAGPQVVPMKALVTRAQLAETAGGRLRAPAVRAKAHPSAQRFELLPVAPLQPRAKMTEAGVKFARAALWLADVRAPSPRRLDDGPEIVASAGDLRKPTASPGMD